MGLARVMEKIITLAIKCGHIHVYGGMILHMLSERSTCWRCDWHGDGNGSNTAGTIKRWRGGNHNMKNGRLVVVDCGHLYYYAGLGPGVATEHITCMRCGRGDGMGVLSDTLPVIRRWLGGQP